MKIIAVASGKGGTGKSCVAAYTGAAFAAAGKKVLVMELGHDPRSQDLILGIEETALFSVHDVLDGACGFDEAVAASGVGGNLHVLPCAPAPWHVTVGRPEFESLMAGMKETAPYDYIILDGVDFSAFPPDICDCILNVVNPETLCVRAAAVLTRLLYDRGARDVRLVINNVPVQILPMAGIDDFDDLIDTVGAQLIAVVPASPKLRYAANNTALIDEDSMAPKVFERLAMRIQGESLPLLVK
ncbi:MAG: AAA family ATPase [Oscillospiraceae bacterium]|nr:AAA family ATPase [Oscillospiraceae bacterium]